MTTEPGRGLKATTRVETTPLSEHLSGEIDFLKMDIEGAEECVIAELSRHNKLKLVKEMVFEYHHHELPGRDALSGVLAALEENGFGYEISALTLPPSSEGGFTGCSFMPTVSKLVLHEQDGRALMRLEQIR